MRKGQRTTESSHHGSFAAAALTMVLMAFAGAAQNTWTLRNPLPTGQTLDDVAWTGEFYVAVGWYGTACVSENGIDWSCSEGVVNGHLSQVEWTGRLLIASAINEGYSYFYSSTDGKAWTSRTSFFVEESIVSLYWTGKLLLAGGHGGMLYTSADTGSTWIRQPLGIYHGIYCFAVKESLLVAGSSSLIDSNSYFITSTDFSTWKKKSSGIHASIKTLAANDSVFLGLAVNDDTMYLFRSRDGFEWDCKRLDSTGAFDGLFWDGKQFVAVGNDMAATNYIFTSTDGIEWQKHMAPGMAGGIYEIIRGPHYILVGSNGNILYSEDAMTWKPGFTGLQEERLRCIAAAADRIIAVGIRGGIATSTDGITWKSNGILKQTILEGAVWTGSSFALIGAMCPSYNGILIKSDNGLLWETIETDIPALHGITWNGMEVVAAGDSVIFGSDLDGFGWETPIDASFQDIAWNGSLFVAAGLGGCVYTSPEGQIWTKRNSGTTEHLYGAAWTGTCFIAAGSGGTVVTSRDGETWKRSRIDSSLTIFDVGSNDSLTAAVAGRAVYLSSDPESGEWKRHETGYSYGLYGVTFFRDLIVVSGDNGAIISSPMEIITAAAGKQKHGDARKDDRPRMVDPYARLKWTESGVVIYNAEGRRLPAAMMHDIDIAGDRLSGLPPGVYFAAIKTDAGMRLKKILVTH